MADQLSHDKVKVIIGMSGNEEVQERVRGKGSFQKAVDAAKRAAQRGNLLGISIWLTKLTLDQIPELLDLAIDIGAKEFSLADYVPQGRTKEIYKKLMPSPQEYEKTLIEIYHYYKELQNKITVFPYTIFSRRIMKTMEPDIDLNKACSLHDWLEVSEDGKVYPCRSMDLMIGDLRKDSLKTIWERLPNSETGELIRKLYRRENIRGKCGQCQFFNICGGCRARALSLTGDMFAADPACPYMPQKEDWATI
jgi:radical SAM protein with 4Fe4S-binding SPASM domain